MEGCGCQEKCPNCECQQKKLLDASLEAFRAVRSVEEIVEAQTAKITIQNTRPSGKPPWWRHCACAGCAVAACAASSATSGDSDL